MVRRPKNWGNIRGGEEDERVPFRGLVPRGYDNMGPFNEVIIGPAGRNAADVEARDHDLQYGEEEAIGVTPHLQWVDADEEFLQDLQPTNWKENLAAGLFSVKKAAKNKGLVRDMSSKAKKWENDPRHKKAISQFERLRKEQETEVGDKRPREVVLDANGGVLKRMRGWQKEHKNNAFDAAAHAEAARARHNAMNVTMGMHNDDPLPDLPDSGDMDVAMGGEETVAPAARASASTSAPGGVNPQSKETPISNYPSLTYGLQETHTTILPWTGWITAAKMDTGAPIQLRVRLNAPIDMIDATITADPGAGTLFPTKGLYKRPSAEDMKGASVDYPETFVTGATTLERPAWRDYWMALYEYYTVLGCEYKITMINPISTLGSAVIIGTQFDSYTDIAGASGNEMPQTNLSETLAFKHIEWDIITGFRAELPNHNATVISGKYTPGQIRRNIQNDGDVKTWIATAGLALPALKDFLTLNFWRAPMATSNVNAVNIQVEVKYIVQFKDLKTQARYPNRTTGTALTQILSTDPLAAGSALQKWGV